MKLDELNAKKDAITQQFNRVQEDKTNAEHELYRLQGEYRLLEELEATLEQHPAKPKKVKQVPEPGKLDVTDTEGA